MKRMMGAVIAVLALANVGLRAAHEPGQELITEPRLAGLPMRLAGYQGADHTYGENIYEVLNADDTVLRKYEKHDADFHWLYVGYYGTAKGGRTGHQPHHCYPAAGFRIVEEGHEVVRRKNGEPVRIQRILVEKDGHLTLALYWNQSRERVFESGLEMNINRVVRRITENRDDGAFVRLSAPVRTSVPLTLERQKALASAVITALPEHWPVEKVANN